MDYRSRTLSPEITGSGGNEDLSWLPVCLDIFRGGKRSFLRVFFVFLVFMEESWLLVCNPLKRLFIFKKMINY